jgi:hypothetical protein
MSFEMTTMVHPTYLHIVVKGSQTIEAVSELVRFIRSTSARESRTRVLVDYRKVTLGELSTRQRLALGDEMGRAIGNSLRVAVVFEAPRLNRASEFTAASEGAQITTVATETEALAWLHKQAR